jgi:4-alpha-glucanotransferase
LTSVANLAVIPAQDVLGLGSDARMNVPSKTVGNWSWRFPPGALTAPLAEKLAALVEVTDRDECVQQPSAQGEESDGKVSENFAA